MKRQTSGIGSDDLSGLMDPTGYFSKQVIQAGGVAKTDARF